MSAQSGRGLHRGLRASLAILAVLAIVALFLTQSIPSRPPCAAGKR